MAINWKRLTIKNLSLDDSNALHAILSDEKVMKYIEPPFDYDKTVDFIKTCALCEPPKVYGIFLKASNELIGHLVFHPYSNDSYELGWIIAQQHWGNGYASDLTEGVINYAKRKHISKLIIECDKQQTITKHIAEKYGFAFRANENNLSIYELELNRLYLYVPKTEELNYRQRIMADPETMSYNKGYDLDFGGYHKDTGCIDFPESEWQEWYNYFIGNEPKRFYAYIVRKGDSAFIGEVNLHKSCDDYYDMGIVLEAKYRGNGYAKEALNLLLQYAFETLKVNAVHNDFEDDRTAAMKIHLDCGFREVKRENNIVHLLITAEDYKAFCGGCDEF